MHNVYILSEHVIVTSHVSYGEEKGNSLVSVTDKVWIAVSWGGVRNAGRGQVRNSCHVSSCLTTEMYWLSRCARRTIRLERGYKYMFLCKHAFVLCSCLTQWVNNLGLSFFVVVRLSF